MEPSDSSELVALTKDNISNDQIIQAAIHLQQGQTRYQNNTFVVGSQVTPYKKVQQALLELETRYQVDVELHYKYKLCLNDKKRLERSLKLEQSLEVPDELEIERLEIELERKNYDLSVYERKFVTVEREISEFCDIVREHMDPGVDMEYYRLTQEHEDRRYWIARMAKQAAVDVHAIGRLGSGNLDSILNMPKEDQIAAIRGAVEHATLLTAGVEKMQQRMLPEVRKIMEGAYDDVALPTLLGEQLSNEPLKLPEVKNVTSEKLRIQSSSKSKA